MNTILRTIFISLIAAFTFYSSITCAAGSNEERTPFDSYARVDDFIFVAEKSLFTADTGAEVLPKSKDENYSRERIGIISLTPTQRAYVDIVWDPVNANVEFIDIKNNNLIHKFIYPKVLDGALLFNGQGAIYQYLRPVELCWGRETKKFVLKNGKFFEVRQPFTYLVNTEAELMTDTSLFFTPRSASEIIASLKAGAKVTVIAIEASWFLIKTPLGLTGWVPREPLSKTMPATLNITERD